MNIERELAWENYGYTADLSDFKVTMVKLAGDRRSWKKGSKARTIIRGWEQLAKREDRSTSRGQKSPLTKAAVLAATTEPVIIDCAQKVAMEEIFARFAQGRKLSQQSLVDHVGQSVVDHFGLSTMERMTRKLGLDAYGTMKRLPGWPFMVKATGRHQDVKYLHPTDFMLEILTKERIGFTPRYRPMLVPPQKWGSDQIGGYLDPRLTKRLTFVVKQSSRFHRDIRALDMGRVHDAVNAVQETAWKINEPVYHVVEKLGSKIIEGAAETWRKRQGRKAGLAGALWVAQDLVHEPSIYFPHHVDHRGRLYSLPSFLSPQGADEVKALLTFAHGKAITTAEQLRWLMIHGANSYGIDKVSHNDRVKWVKYHEPMILKTAAAPLTETEWRQAEAPFQFLAFCFEWKRLTDYRRAHGGSFRGFESSLPVGMDGSCNGLQHLSAMLRDAEGGAAVNLMPAKVPQDVYGKVAKYVEDRLKAGDSPMATAWLAFGIDRKMMKGPVMKFYYAQTAGQRKNDLAEQIKAHADYKRDKRRKTKRWQGHPLFASFTTPPSRFLEPIIVEAIRHCAPAAEAVMTWLQEVAEAAAGANVPLYWVSPAGFPVLVWKVRKETRKETVKMPDGSQERLEFRVPAAPTAHIGKEKGQRGSVSAVTADFVHSLDAAHLMETALEARGAAIESFHMVHDNYGTTAADAPTLARILRETFVAMYDEHDALAEFTRFIPLPRNLFGDRAPLPARPKQDKLEIRAVLDSPYFFA